MHHTRQTALDYLFRKQEEEADYAEELEDDGRCNGSGNRALSWSERSRGIELRSKPTAGGAGAECVSKLSTANLSRIVQLPAGGVILFALVGLIAYNSGRFSGGQMFTFLHTLPIVLWFGGIATQLALAVILPRRGIAKTFPWFTAYVVQFNVAASFLLALGFSGHAKAYSNGFYLSATIDALLSIMVVGELGAVTLPRRARSQMFTIYMGAAMAGAYLLVGSVGTLFMAENPWRRSAQLMLALATATLWVMVLCKEKLELFWSDRARGMAHGMLLYMTVDMITTFMNGRVKHPTAELAGDLSQLAYMVATILWCRAFWNQKAPVSPPTPEDLSRLRSMIEESDAELAGIETEARQRR